MKSQPNRNYESNDVVYTPRNIARDIIQHFNPKGFVLEPAKGNGAFYDYLPDPKDWCEISEGRDFFEYTTCVDWIITNPPWSMFKRFLQHSLSLANDIVFLITINHIWTKARLRLLNSAGFGIREILLVDTPKSFPQTGFQLGAIHIQKHYNGAIDIKRLHETGNNDGEK